MDVRKARAKSADAVGKLAMSPQQVGIRTTTPPRSPSPAKACIAFSSKVACAECGLYIALANDDRQTDNPADQHAERPITVIEEEEEKAKTLPDLGPLVRRDCRSCKEAVHCTCGVCDRNLAICQKCKSNKLLNLHQCCSNKFLRELSRTVTDSHRQHRSARISTEQFRNAILAVLNGNECEQKLQNNSKITPRSCQHGPNPISSTLNITFKSGCADNCQQRQLADDPPGTTSHELTVHFSFVGAFLYDLFRNSSMTDVVLRFGDTDFAAHSVVLAAGSELLARILIRREPSAEAQLNLASTITAALFENVLEFLYTGRIGLTEGNVVPVMMAAAQLEIPALVRKTKVFIKNSNLDFSNKL